MSATEWLHFINPFIVTAFVAVLVASIPVTNAWREEFHLSDKPTAMKKTLLWSSAFIALGWFFAWSATHISTPIIRVNVMATSQIILTISLIVVGIVTIRRLFQHNSVVSMLLVLAKRHLPDVITVLGTITFGLFILFLDSSKNARKQQEELDEENEPYRDPKGFMNYRGDYCDKNKSTWYF